MMIIFGCVSFGSFALLFILYKVYAIDPERQRLREDEIHREKQEYKEKQEQ